MQLIFHKYSFMYTIVNYGDIGDEEDGTRHFMVNVIQPQFNLHSEEANVSVHFSAFFVLIPFILLF